MCVEGDFRVDSFTYTPFIDHLKSEDADPRDGAYADCFLIAYNH